MTLFYSLLPLYIFGNVHCLAMCGPLVMMIGQHRFRYFYFIGRLLSFSLAGFIAGGAGAVLHVFLKQYYLAETVSILFGMGLIFWGIYTLTGRVIYYSSLNKNATLNAFQQWISLLLLRDTILATFLFGFFTVVLPCGQTFLVFSACALNGDPLVGLGNGFALALITSPSLFLAMNTLTLLKKLKRYDRSVLGYSSILIGVLSVLRGFAEMGWVSHLKLDPFNSNLYHVVIF